jgi:hypothetical protein
MDQRRAVALDRQFELRDGTAHEGDDALRLGFHVSAIRVAFQHPPKLVHGAHDREEALAEALLDRRLDLLLERRDDVARLSKTTLPLASTVFTFP